MPEYNQTNIPRVLLHIADYASKSICLLIFNYHNILC